MPLCAGHQIPAEYLDEWTESLSSEETGEQSARGEKWMGCRMVVQELVSKNELHLPISSACVALPPDPEWACDSV